jgi:hypothetical protein
MTLAEWLKSQGWTNRRLADALGRSEEYARLLRAGLRRPRHPADRGQHVFDVYAEDIMRITSGAVTADDLETAYQQRRRRKPKLGPIRKRI